MAKAVTNLASQRRWHWIFVTIGELFFRLTSRRYFPDHTWLWARQAGCIEKGSPDAFRVYCCCTRPCGCWCSRSAIVVCQQANDEPWATCWLLHHACSTCSTGNQHGGRYYCDNHLLCNGQAIVTVASVTSDQHAFTAECCYGVLDYQIQAEKVVTRRIV